MKILFLIVPLPFGVAASANDAARTRCNALRGTLDESVDNKDRENVVVRKEEVDKVLLILRNNPVPPPARSQVLRERAFKVKSYKEYGDLVGSIMSEFCYTPRQQLHYGLVESAATLKLNAKQKKAITEAVRKQLQSEFNSFALGILLNSALAKRVCERKLDKEVGVKCEGLDEFMTELKEQMPARRAMSKETIDGAFTLTGRILHYWDKLFNKEQAEALPAQKDPKGLDRYYDFEPYRKYLATEEALDLQLLERFESFLVK